MIPWTPGLRMRARLLYDRAYRVRIRTTCGIMQRASLMYKLS